MTSRLSGNACSGLKTPLYPQTRNYINCFPPQSFLITWRGHLLWLYSAVSASIGSTAERRCNRRRGRWHATAAKTRFEDSACRVHQLGRNLPVPASHRQGLCLLVAIQKTSCFFVFSVVKNPCQSVQILGSPSCPCFTANFPLRFKRSFDENAQVAANKNQKTGKIFSSSLTPYFSITYKLP